MTEDLLQDLVLYKKSHEKAVSSAARSLITLFREVIAVFCLSSCECILVSLFVEDVLCDKFLFFCEKLM